jgi:hypothetical protein
VLYIRELNENACCFKPDFFETSPLVILQEYIMCFREKNVSERNEKGCITHWGSRGYVGRE